MAGTRRGRYPPEYKERMIELVRAGRSPGSLAREFEPSEQTIRNWVKQADLDEGRRSDGLTTEARKEMRELKREVKRLRMERDILRKAAAWFARESGSIPGGDRAIDGLGRRRVRQRDVRELLRDTRVRTPRPAELPDRSRGTARSLQLHRGLLQHPPAPLGARLQVAGDL